MIKTLTKHGNSLALVIEKPVLELIGADADTQFDAALEKVNARYPKALKKLAE